MPSAFKALCTSTLTILTLFLAPGLGLLAGASVVEGVEELTGFYNSAAAALTLLLSLAASLFAWFAAYNRIEAKDDADHAFSYVAYDRLRFAQWVRAQLRDGDDFDTLAKRLAPDWNSARTASQPSLEQRCRHEAAHATIAHILGGVVLSADIRVRGDTAGQVDSVGPLPKRSIGESAWIDMLVSTAGWTQDTLDERRNASAVNDIQKANFSAHTVLSADYRPDGYRGPLTRDGLIRHARTTNIKLLRTHSHIVKALAAALKEHIELPGSDVRDVIEAAETATPV